MSQLLVLRKTYVHLVPVVPLVVALLCCIVRVEPVEGSHPNLMVSFYGRDGGPQEPSSSSGEAEGKAIMSEPRGTKIGSRAAWQSLS